MRKRHNLLAMSPVLTATVRLDRSEDASILLVERKSWLERLSVRFLKQPACFRIRLDDLGTQVLSQCTGKQTVQEIADELGTRFGEAAEPVLPRLVMFLQIVEEHGWIRWEKEKR